MNNLTKNSFMKYPFNFQHGCSLVKNKTSYHTLKINFYDEN